MLVIFSFSLTHIPYNNTPPPHHHLIFYQCYEIDQFAASKDDVVGQQHSSIWKRPSGADHQYLDQELAGLFEYGLESLPTLLRPSAPSDDNHVILFEDSIKREDPERALSEHFIPLSDDMTR